ncbi:hypothetical protein MM236_14185 [Belliella sp. DSM 107340]|uniref:DUF2779 domain-containing protein n=1 Tax=Belliella calami TaxID=2923436 RepID=A0ABS9URA5_9BACT|nr:hypothetical protein [Belliella calami]MCH7399149.1 hypothetical protein [Belliella calami]
MRIEKLLSLHQDFFLDFGFVFDPIYFYFTKSIPEGKQVVFFHHIQNPDANYIEYQLGVRLDKVENIINEFLPSLGDFKDRSITHVVPLDQINRDFPRRYFLDNNLDLNKIFGQIESFFIEEGFKWLDYYSIPENLEFLFNSNPDQELTTQNFTYRSARAITICKLYNSKEYELTKKAYLDKLEEMMVTPFTLASFLNLLAHLESL